MSKCPKLVGNIGLVWFALLGTSVSRGVGQVTTTESDQIIRGDISEPGQEYRALRYLQRIIQAESNALAKSNDELLQETVGIKEATNKARKRAEELDGFNSQCRYALPRITAKLSLYSSEADAEAQFNRDAGSIRVMAAELRGLSIGPNPNVLMASNTIPDLENMARSSVGYAIVVPILKELIKHLAKAVPIAKDVDDYRSREQCEEGLLKDDDEKWAESVKQRCKDWFDANPTPSPLGDYPEPATDPESSHDDEIA